MVMMRKLIWVGVLLGVPCFAQKEGPPTVPTPSYDVSTIKLNKTGSGHVGISIDDGNFTTDNTSLKDLLAMAFDVRRDMILGLPPWAEKERFDISAKVVNPDKAVMDKLTDEQYREMLRKLLEERFAVKVHKEAKILPVYELVVLKDGPKFKPGLKSEGNDGTSQHSTRVTTQIQARNVQMSSFAKTLSDDLHKTVIDKTGLTEKYDFEAKWLRDDAPTVAGSGDSNEETPPTVYTALQEQLGLKLVPAKGPVDTIVIDHIEEPTDN